MPWPKHCWRPETVNGTGGSQWCHAVAKRSSCCIATLARLPFILPCVANLCLRRLSPSHMQAGKRPNLFWRGRRKNLDAVNRLDNLFQGTCSVHGLRFSRSLQPAKRVRKRRAIRLCSATWRANSPISEPVIPGTSSDPWPMSANPMKRRLPRRVERRSRARRGSCRRARAGLRVL